jgi:hypothetical protein
MNPDDIRQTSGGVAFWLREIAAQLAEQNALARVSHKGVRDRSTPVATCSVRLSSTTKRFYVDHWSTAVEANMMPSFVPDEAQPALDELIVSQSTMGLLGTHSGARIKRIQ